MRSHTFTRRACALLVVSGVTCVALVAATASVAKAPAPSKVYIAANGCTGHSYKPPSVVLACADGNLSASKLKYSSYGTREASATGSIRMNTCTPNCAAGKFKTQAGSIRFSTVVRCKEGRSYFTRAKYKFGKSSGTADIEPISCKKS